MTIVFFNFIKKYSLFEYELIMTTCRLVCHFRFSKKKKSKVCQNGAYKYIALT